MSPFLAPSGAAVTATERGLSQSEILRLQRILEALGFTDGGRMTPDGVIGPRTRAALTAYQRARALRVVGQIGPETLGSLNRESVAASTPTTPAPAPATPSPATPAPTTPAAPSPSTPAVPAPSPSTPATPSTASPNTPATTANAASMRSNWPLALGVGAIVVGAAYLASRESSRRKKGL